MGTALSKPIEGLTKEQALALWGELWNERSATYSKATYAGRNGAQPYFSDGRKLTDRINALTKLYSLSQEEIDKQMGWKWEPS